MAAVALLTMTEVAELEGVHRTSILRRVETNKIQAIKSETSNGRRGYEYRISLDQLSDKARRKYYEQQRQKAGELLAGAGVGDGGAVNAGSVGYGVDGGQTTPSAPSRKASGSIVPTRKEAVGDLTLTGLTATQRADVDFWLAIIKDYNLYISNCYKNTTTATKDFVATLTERYPDRSISERTLRRKVKDYREMGAVGLADLRLQNKLKGSTVLNEIAWSAFLQYWLDEARPSVTVCYKIVGDFLRLEGRKHPELLELLPLPDVSAVYRQVKKLPHPVVQFYRYGNKAYSDDCEPYLERDYEGLDSNEVWSADYHTLDFSVKCDKTGSVFRPYLCAWIDVRSRKIVGMSLRKSADSDGVVIAFRKAVSKYGIPSIFYADNGREFATHDFGGRGRRKSSQKTMAEVGESILSRLGVVMHNSQVANAKAKAIERFFGEICRNFSKFVGTYLGGTPADRPERMRGDLRKKDNTPLFSEVQSRLEAYIEGYYNNQPSNAKGLKGLSPNDCWQQNLVIKKTATKEQLDLLMLRSGKLQEVKRNGVYVDISGEKVWFYSTELVTQYMKHKVYVRYNPDDLTVAHIYDNKERYICEAAMVVKGDYNFGVTDADGVDGETSKTTEAIKELNRNKKAQKQVVTDFMGRHKSNIKVKPAMDVIQEVALERMADMAEYSETADYIYQPLEFSKPQKVVGIDDWDKVDIGLMAENAAKSKARKQSYKL